VQLERSRGVGEVTVVGGLERAINIWLDADRLAMFELPVTSVRDALLRQNSQVPGGNVTSAARRVEPPDARAYHRPGGVRRPRSRDARRHADPRPRRRRAEDGTKEQRSIARLDDVPTVILEVRRQSGANTVAVIDAAKASLAAIAPSCRPTCVSR
jgi:HAE1 family hydrophobic/amphiphilic exporter-1